MGVPDRRDTVGIGKSTMGGVASRGLQTLPNTVLGTLLGLANTVLVAANLPPYTPAGGLSLGTGSLAGNYNGGQPVIEGSGGGGIGGGGTFGIPGGTGVTISGAPSGAFIGTPQGGTSTAFNNVQPSTTCNYIVRIG